MAFDLIADVMRAADRTSLAQAQSRLAQTAAKPGRASLFAGVSALVSGKMAKPASLPNDLVADVMAAAPAAARNTAVAKLEGAAGGKPPAGLHGAMQGLQSALLSTMVDAMVPKEQVSLYGEGTAGEIWRGFQVNQFSDELAQADVLGLNQPRPQAGAEQEAVGRVVQWPYFQAGSITSFVTRS